MDERVERLNKLVVDCQWKMNAGQDYSDRFREILLLVGEIWTGRRIESVIRDFIAGRDKSASDSQDIGSMAQDIRQEVLLKVYEQAIRAYKPETAAFSTYLYRLVYNSVVDALRRVTIEKRIFKHTSSSNPAEGEITDILRDSDTDDLIERLPHSTYREIIRRHYLQGEKLVDIADDINMSAVLVGVYKRRALNELRKLLEEERE